MSYKKNVHSKDDSGKAADPMAMVIVPPDVLAVLKLMDLDDVEPRNIDCIFEPVSMPFYMHIEFSGDNIHLRAFNRGSFPIAHTLDGVSVIDVNVDASTGQAIVNCYPKYQDIVIALIDFCIDLNRYIVKFGIEDMINKVDKEHEAVLLSRTDKNIEAKIVEGKERPDLLSTVDLFMLHTDMARPYSDEIDDLFEFE